MEWSGIRPRLIRRLAAAGLLMITPCAAQVVISEFMAKNDNSLVDGDGNASDWIELCNTGTGTVDLTGWFLSDSTADLRQWSFPSTSIGAGEYLVVFASGQETDDHIDSLGYRHTNFRLNGDGESVVLTRPDGVTIEHSFIDYPAQSDDVSYGLAQESRFVNLVVEEQDAKAFIGTSEPASTWKTTGYNDAGWLSGATGVGFEEGGTTYGGSINLDVIAMFTQRTESTYIRIAFEVDDPGAISLLTLRMMYDDGFVAYLNGTEVASENAPTSPTHASQAVAQHDSSGFEEFVLSNPSSYLQTGVNILAIHALDYPAGTPDLFIMPTLAGITAGDLETDSFLYYDTPTPGAGNVAGVVGYVEETEFSVDHGFFTSGFDVAISTATEGASIYYTLDGNTPTEAGGTLYSGPVAISGTTVLRAAAFKTGHQPSQTGTRTYLFISDIVSQPATAPGAGWPSPGSGGGWPPGSGSQAIDYEMDPQVTGDARYSDLVDDALLAIPSVSIVTDLDNLFDSGSGIYMNPDGDGPAWERPASVELLNPDGSEGFQINGGIRIRGGVSRSTSNPKHSFRLFFRPEYGTARLKFPLFGDEGADSFKRVDLRTGQNYSWQFMNPRYATWLYDIFTRDTHREMGRDYTRGRYCHLYLNGVYWGLYQTEERPDSRYAESYHGGDSDDYDAVKADGDTGVMYAADGTTDAYNELWAGVVAGVSNDADYFRLQGMNPDGTRNDSLTRLLDVDSVIDYMLAVFYTANRDSPIGPPDQDRQPRNLNCIYNRVNPDGFKFIAHDNEHSMEAQYGVSANRVSTGLGSSFSQQSYFTPWWLHLRLMNNAEYKLRFADHVREHFFNGGALTPAAAAGRIAARRDEIDLAIIAESARWGDSASTSPRTRDDDWLPAVDRIVDNFIQASPSTRTSVVLAQLSARGWYPGVAAPQFNQHGGSVASGFALSISGPGQIYYTLDGSDPREVGTGSAVGTPYAGPVSLTRSTRVKARVLEAGTWSALTAATFELSDESPLRVTEMMYHPAEGGSGDEVNFGNEEFEFIELLNTGTGTIGLAGTEFTNGIYFDFSEGDVLTLDPGEYVLLVNNLEAFTLRYPGAAGMNIAGEYHGKFFLADADLANNGEGITLRDGLGRTILDFVYDDWYPLTEGAGYSLTLIDPTADKGTWSDSDAWRPSAAVGGTPGEAAADPDSDSDGMPDSWESYYFGALSEGGGDDWDGDGCSNSTELGAGTDPTDPESLFHITGISPTASSVTVTWSSEPGRTYTLQCSPDLRDGSWVTVESGLDAIPPANSYTHHAAGTAAFYRVIVE